MAEVLTKNLDKIKSSDVHARISAEMGVEIKKGHYILLSAHREENIDTENICHPGITRGMHWHVTKTEEFIVVSGRARIRERRLGSDEIEEYIVDGEHIQSVIMKPGFTHEIP